MCCVQLDLNVDSTDTPEKGDNAVQHDVLQPANVPFDGIAACVRVSLTALQQRLELSEAELKNRLHCFIFQSPGTNSPQEVSSADDVPMSYGHQDNKRQSIQ